MQQNPTIIKGNMTNYPISDLALWEPKRSITLEAARRHTRNIVWMRKALLLICAGLFAYVIWSFSQQKEDTISSTISGTDSAVMVNPRYNGRTGDGLPYKLTADTATRPDYDSNEVTLESPVIEFFRKEDVPSSFLRAQSGLYDDVAQVISLSGNVVLETDDGNLCTTTQARLSTQDKIISGSKPIECRGNFGNIKGQEFSITDNYSTFTFSGGMTGEIIPNNVSELGKNMPLPSPDKSLSDGLRQ